MRHSTYLTVKEMRENPELIDPAGREKGSGGARFEESTVPELALRYFPKTGRILECGAIFGKFTEFLQKNGYHDIHVLDFVDRLEFPDRKKLTFHEVDFNFEKFPYQDNFFDGVAAWGIGEHLENPFHFAREIFRVLRGSGTFIFSIPNMFHIISRLIFLKRGMFPRWDKTNNHISILPRGVFEKTFLKYFNLVETLYVKPELRYLFLNKFSRWLPQNQWFGSYIVYILTPQK